MTARVVMLLIVWLGLLVGGVSVLVTDAVSARQAVVLGVEGSVTVEDCAPVRWRSAAGQCRGTFTADGGAFRIAEVDVIPVRYTFPELPYVTRAAVSGPDATEAYPLNYAWSEPLIWAGIFAVAMLAGGWWMLHAVLRDLYRDWRSSRRTPGPPHRRHPSRPTTSKRLKMSKRIRRRQR